MADEKKQRNDSFGDPMPDGASQRLGTSRLRHLDDNWMDTEVYAAVVAPNLCMLASASKDASEPGYMIGFEMNPIMGSVQLFDVTTGVNLLHIREHDPNVQPMTFSPDGRFLYEGRQDGSIRFWNMQTLQPSVHLDALRPESDDEEKPDLHDFFCLSVDGRRIAAANDQAGQVEVWDLELVQLLYKLGTDGRPIRSVRLEGQDRFVLVELAAIEAEDDEEEAKAVLLMWDLAHDQEICRIPVGGKGVLQPEAVIRGIVKELTGNQQAPLPASSTSAALTPSAGTSTLKAVCEGRALSLVERDSNNVVLKAAGHKNWVMAIMPLSDGERLATSSTDGTVRLWNWRTGELIETLIEEEGEKLMALALSPDGSQLAAAGTSGLVNVYDLAEQRKLAPFRVSQGTVNTLLFWDNDTLFAGSNDCSVTAWDVLAGACEGTVVSCPYHFEDLLMAPDGLLLMKDGSGTIGVFDFEVQQIRHVFRIENETWSCMAISPDGEIVVRPETGRRLATAKMGGEKRLGFRYQSVLRRWNVKSGEALDDFVLQADSVRAFALAFSPDGRFLAVGDQEGRVFLLDAGTGTEEQFWLGHKAMVTSLVFLDNTTLASGSADTTVLIWPLAPDLRKESLRLLRHGEYYVKKGQLDKAIEELTTAIQLDPNLAAAFAHRGEAFARKQEFDKALVDITEAIALAPPDKSDVLFANRGRFHASKGDYKKAIEDFTRAIDHNPTWSSPYSNRGYSYCQEGDYPKALADLAEAIRLNPNDTKPLYNRILVHEKMGYHYGAIADLSRLLELDPGRSQLLEKRGQQYFAAGQYQNAVNDFNEILQQNNYKNNAVIMKQRDQAVQALGQ